MEDEVSSKQKKKKKKQSLSGMATITIGQVVLFPSSFQEFSLYFPSDHWRTATPALRKSWSETYR